MSKANGDMDISVKRVMLQFINFFIEDGCIFDMLISDFEAIVYDYPNGLQTCGDFEFQFAYTEAILRLSQHCPKQVDRILADADSDLFENLKSINKKKFDETCRMFLNKFNLGKHINLQIKKVFSFPCIASSFGKIPWKKSNNDTTNNWVDVNEGSSCISFNWAISDGYEGEQFVPLYLLCTEIHHISCVKLNDVNLVLIVELLKECVEYPISSYSHFETISGNSAVFVLEEHVEMVDVASAFEAINIPLNEHLSQNFISESDYVGEVSTKVSAVNFVVRSYVENGQRKDLLGVRETATKASAVNFPVRPYVDNDDEDLPSTATYEVNGTQVIECRSSDEENWNLNYQHEAISAAKASVAKDIVNLSSQETIDICIQKPDIANPDEHERLSKMPASRDKHNGKSCIDLTQQSDIYLIESSPQINKASLAINCIPCGTKAHLGKLETEPTTASRHFETVSIENSSEEEFMDTETKRKCKFTKKRKKNNFSSKMAKKKLMSNFPDEKSDVVHHNRKYKSILLSANSKVEVEPGYLSSDETIEDDGSVCTSEKIVSDAATQCTLTSIVYDQNDSPIPVPRFSNKSTMCSPGMLSGPSSTVRQTLTNIENDTDAKSLNFEKKQWIMDKSNIICEFGEKVRSVLTEKLEALSVKQISSTKCILRQFQNVWENHLKTSMEQVTAHLDSCMTEIQEILKQEELSTSMVMGGYDTFMKNMNALEETS